MLQEAAQKGEEETARCFANCRFHGSYPEANLR
jgi:hypothetical protein